MESWRATLAAGDKEGAWRDFIARYRRLIIATIRRTIGNDDDVEDVFAEVCANLSADDLARLKRHSDTGTARLATWLVTVVHHQTIDWVRQREGRRRVRIPPGLSPLQNQIFTYVFDERRSHVEAYELIKQHGSVKLDFAEYLKEVAETYHAVERSVGKAAIHYLPGPPVLSEEPATVEDAIIAAERAGQLTSALRVLPPDERLAIKLFVVEDVGADRVSRIVGWPNAKAVYNRVHRALQVLRKELERAGIDRSDQ